MVTAKEPESEDKDFKAKILSVNQRMNNIESECDKENYPIICDIEDVEEAEAKIRLIKKQNDIIKSLKKEISTLKRK